MPPQFQFPHVKALPLALQLENGSTNNRISLSVIRVLGLKLAVVCLLAVLASVSAKDGHTLRTCSLSAAIAFASAAHAFVLFKERQGYCEDEVRVDALRTSEFSVTLILTSLLLHTVAEDADPANLNVLSTHTAAVLQTVLVLFFAAGRVYSRFRMTLTLLAVLLWVWMTIDLLLLVGWPFSKSGSAREGAVLLWTVSLVGLGYPTLKAVRIEPPRKDVIHAVLDGVCRGGLGFFCVLRAWV